VNRKTVSFAIALSWLVPVIAAGLAGGTSYKHNEMCIPSHSRTRLGTLTGKIFNLEAKKNFTSVSS